MNEAGKSMAMRLTRTTIVDESPITRGDLQEVIDIMSARLEAAQTQYELMTREAVRHTISSMANDAVLQDRFWQSGFEAFQKRTCDGASKWIGARILVWLASAALVVALTYLINTGRLK